MPLNLELSARPPGRACEQDVAAPLLEQKVELGRFEGLSTNGLYSIAQDLGAREGHVRPNEAEISELRGQFSALIKGAISRCDGAEVQRDALASKLERKYDEGRLLTVYKSAEDLGRAGGELLGRRKFNKGQLEALDSELTKLRENNGALLSAYTLGNTLFDARVARGEEDGISKCLKIERVATSIYAALCGSTSSIAILRPFCRWPFSRQAQALYALKNLDAQSLDMLKEVFAERYGTSIELLCEKVMFNEARQCAQSLLSPDQVTRTAGRLAYLFAQGRVVRASSTFALELRDELHKFNGHELAKLGEHFKTVYGAKFNANSLEELSNSNLTGENNVIARSYLSGDKACGDAVLLHLLLSEETGDKKRAIKLMEKIAKCDCAYGGEVAARFRELYGGELLACARDTFRFDLALGDLFEAALCGDRILYAIGKLHRGLRGKKDSWPGEAFLGLDSKDGEALIAKFDDRYGAGEFARMFKSYRNSDHGLIRALIKNKYASPAEIYWAAMDRIGCDMESLTLLLKNSTNEQLRVDAQQFEKLWEERNHPIWRSLKRVVLPITEKFRDHPSLEVVARIGGAYFGKLFDRIWFETMGDEWKELRIRARGKTDDVKRSFLRMRELYLHETDLPLVRLGIRLKRYQPIALRSFVRKLRFEHFSGEARSLTFDFLRLRRLLNGDGVARDPRLKKHFKAALERVEIDIKAFRERKQYVSHFVAATVAGTASAIVGASTLLLLKSHPIYYSLPLTMGSMFTADLAARIAVKGIMKGLDSITYGEFFTDLGHSSINSCTMFLKRTPTAVGALKRLIGDPVLERTTDLATKVGGKWTLTQWLRWLITKQTANHILTAEQLKRGCGSEETSAPQLGEFIANADKLHPLHDILEPLRGERKMD